MYVSVANNSINLIPDQHAASDNHTRNTRILWTALFSPMPKCSFHMVCRPIIASVNSFFSSSNGMFSLNSTLSATPSSWHNPLSISTLSSSSWFRHPPISTSFTSFLLPASSLCLSRSFRKDLTCSRWSFSGRNWATDTMVWHFLPSSLSSSSSKGISRKAWTSQGG